MRSLLFLLCFVFTLQLAAQDGEAKSGEGMQFVEKPFAELLADAKAQDKVIFIDAYTTWCGPCKMMAAKVFPLPEVGKVYNERFINAKIDMEKGEGPELARRYGVMAYPTYLFVDGNGDIVHKGIGYIPGEAFLALADAAAGENNLGAMNKRYAGGERSEDFMRAYAQTLTQVYEQDKADAVTGEYLATVEDWSQPETMSLLVKNPGPLDGERMAYLVDHPKAAAAAAEGQLIGVLQRQFVGHVMRSEQLRTMPEPAVMATTYKKHGGKMAKQLAANYDMMYAERTRDMEAYVPAAIKYVKAYGSDNFAELNSIAWTIFENSDDQDQLQAALGFAKKSVELQEGYPNLDTLAWLYQKTGQMDKAKETARRAIELAKASGQDYSDTERILSM